jgi:hypothetical protein
MAVAIAGWALPASAVYYVSHWDFSSDPLGEFDYTGHNDLVNEGNVPIVDGSAAFDGTVKSLVTRHEVGVKSNQPYTIECFALAEPDCEVKITGRVLDPSEFMTKRSSPPGVTITIR